MINKNKPLSEFAKFFIEFSGYDFYDNVARITRPKYMIWHGFNYLSRIMLQKKKPVSRFTLIDREGWEKGIKLKKKDLKDKQIG